jgi:hypothetical protein
VLSFFFLVCSKEIVGRVADWGVTYRCVLETEMLGASARSVFGGAGIRRVEDIATGVDAVRMWRVGSYRGWDSARTCCGVVGKSGELIGIWTIYFT